MIDPLNVPGTVFTTNVPGTVSDSTLPTSDSTLPTSTDCTVQSTERAQYGKRSDSWTPTSRPTTLDDAQRVRAANTSAPITGRVDLARAATSPHTSENIV